MSSSDPASSSADPTSDEQALLQAVRRILRPVAALAVAKGLPFATVEDILKLAFVDAARQAQNSGASHRLVSRISTATGLNRREVTRLVQMPEQAAPKRSLSSEVFTRWLTDRKLCDRSGEPKALPRQGAKHSFESLAQSVTRDVHPRSLLEELCRLGLARWDEEHDTVHAVRDAFVPRGDVQRMLGFLGENTGDHVSAAVANVVDEGKGDSPHFEQAVFADELSAQSLQAVRGFVRAQWKHLLDESVPFLEQLIADDAQAGRTQDQRLRIGLFTYAEPMAGGAQASTEQSVAESAGKTAAKAARGRGAPSGNKPKQARTTARGTGSVQKPAAKAAKNAKGRS